MQIIEQLGELGIQPIEIGFSSFTKAARQTAAMRAAYRFGYDPLDLMKSGWFRTLHSVCYQMLGVNQSQFLGDSKSAKEWLSNVFGEPVEPAAIDADTGFPVLGSSGSRIASVLAWWGMCRNCLQPVGKMLKHAPLVHGMTLDEIIKLIERYESRKRIDDRLDFADLPLRVAGIRHDIADIVRVSPCGEPPPVRAWILDEYQDTFPAIHAAARHIVSSPMVDYIFCSGDVYQSIYGFSGGNPRFLMSGWEYTAEEILRQSHRCPPAVMDLAEDTIRGCSDYFDRKIIPRHDPSGGVASATLDPRGPQKKIEGNWLFIARTNGQANQLGSWLSRAHVPWASTKDGAYIGPSQRRIGKALMDLHEGRFIAADEWIYLVGHLQVVSNGQQLLQPGFKTRAAKMEDVRSEMPDQINVHGLTSVGATPHLVRQLTSDNWQHVYKDPGKVDRFYQAALRYGPEAALNPTIEVGTIHSVKGAEADNVMLYDAITKTCRTGLYDAGRDEELRVWYVGATRARHRLIAGRFRTDKAAMYRFIK